MPGDFSSESVGKKLQEAKELKEPLREESITTPLEEIKEKEEKRNAVLGLVNDVKSQREDINRLNESMEFLATKMGEMSTVINQMAQGMQAPTNQDNKAMLGDLLNSDLGSKLMDKLLPQEAPAPSFIDQNYINEQVKQSVMSNFEIGDALVKNLKSKLVNKAVSASVSDALKETEAHGPA